MGVDLTQPSLLCHLNLSLKVPVVKETLWSGLTAHSNNKADLPYQCHLLPLTLCPQQQGVWQLLHCPWLNSSKEEEVVYTLLITTIIIPQMEHPGMLCHQCLQPQLPRVHSQDISLGEEEEGSWGHLVRVLRRVQGVGLLRHHAHTS